MTRRAILGACALAILAGIGWRVAAAEELAIDLSAAGAAGQWVFLDKTATIAGGELVLDGREQMSRAFFSPLVWEDVTLRAEFLVEPAERGVLACGFVVRAVDARTYYYVHFDRGQAILVRSDSSQSWNEIKRMSGLDKPAGVQSPENIDGISYLPTLLGEETRQKKHEYLYWKYYGTRAVRMGKWKAVGQPTGNRLQLFDLETDPGESKNVAADNPQVVDRMKKLMEAADVESPDFK